jgi:cation diffusion facilitator CzcD-associated flavoprotein CzcO
MTVSEQAPDTTAAEAVHTRALIIGSGFSGLGMGIFIQ